MKRETFFISFFSSDDNGGVFIVLEDDVILDILTMHSKSARMYFNSVGNIVGVGFRIHYEFAEESPGKEQT